MSLGAVLAAVVLLVANAFFVAVEFSVVATRRTRLDEVAPEGLRLRLARRALAELPFQFAGVQLGVTMASLGLGFVAEPALEHFIVDVLGESVSDRTAEIIAVAVTLTIVVFLHTVMGEMVPKSLAITEPELWLLRLAGPMRVFLVLLGPVIRALDAMASGIMRLLRVPIRSELVSVHTAEEIGRLLVESRETGLLEEEEAQRLSGAIEIRTRSTADVMVPRERIVAVPRTTSLAGVEALVLDTGHSRVPVFGRNLDNVLGFVHVKDLLTVADDERDRPIPVRLIRRMLVVGEQRPLDQLLGAMRRARLHVALVVDQQGRTVGIVTLEDVLEEVVGEIRDESD